jgi:hypothetical protein
MMTATEPRYVKPSDGKLYAPFAFRYDPMERLMLINIEKDPDSTYIGFEPQAFDDAVHGRGLLVIAYRRDRRIDVYHQPSLDMTSMDYGIVGEGLAALEARPMPGARFTIGPHGVDFAAEFDDVAGRRIRLSVREGDRRPRRPFTILAPLGSDTARPPSLPLVFLFGFDFVRRAGSEILVQVAGRAHRPDTLPVPIDLRRVYFMRYAAEPLIVFWNPNYEGALPAFDARGRATVTNGHNAYDLASREGHPELASMRLIGATAPCTVAFTPPLPDLPALGDGTVTGDFEITTHESGGSVMGGYRIERQGARLKMALLPSGGWKPKVTKPSVWLIFTLVRVFRHWPATYLWEAAIDLDAEPPSMQSGWRRV